MGILFTSTKHPEAVIKLSRCSLYNKSFGNCPENTVLEKLTEAGMTSVVKYIDGNEQKLSSGKCFCSTVLTKSGTTINWFFLENKTRQWA